MALEASVVLKRAVTAVRIPSGEEIALEEGTPVTVTQALGGSFTIAVPSQSGLFRIRDADADALGANPLEPEAAQTGEFSLERVWDQLRNCYDPEIPVNIVDLGLIYSLEAVDDESGAGKRISAKMTLTAPGCGMGPTLAADAQRRILNVPGVTTASVDLVWEPQWTPELISQAGRDKLGMV